MNKRSLFVMASLVAAAVTGVADVSMGAKVDTKQSRPLPRVLLIGDSICGGYQRVRDFFLALRYPFVYSDL